MPGRRPEFNQAGLFPACLRQNLTMKKVNSRKSDLKGLKSNSK